MNHLRMRRLVFCALCCDLGLFAKRLIAPVTNLFTDALRIPGGIGTAFSLLFLVLAAALLQRPGCAVLMAAVQSALAVSLGMVGSMGVLSPLGYLLPGLVIDAVLWAGRRTGLTGLLPVMLANMLGSVAAALTANAIVFNLRGVVLALYLTVSLLSGALCGLLASKLLVRLAPNLQGMQDRKGEQVK